MFNDNTLLNAFEMLFRAFSSVSRHLLLHGPLTPRTFSTEILAN